VKVGAWCAVSARRTIGAVFLTERLNAKDKYRSFLSSSFQIYQKKKDYDWFQQDSATAHTARSPDLNHCDFFFWDCLKDTFYNGNPKTEEGKKAKGKVVPVLNFTFTFFVSYCSHC
jgi:hypothetical protein